MAHNFLTSWQLLAVKNLTSAAATGIIDLSGVLDTLPYDAVVCMVQHGTTGSSNGMRALMGTASASAGLSQVQNSFVTALSTATMLEIHRPPNRYVQFQAIREASEKLGSAFVFGKAEVLPSTNDTAGLVSSRILLSPRAGSATDTGA